MAEGANELVEHFFRHESGRLVALLTRSLGVARIDLAEDVVQAALMQALQIWARRGVPEDPGAWLYRTARNLAVDQLRREKTAARVLPHAAASEAWDGGGDEPTFVEEIGDEPLRLLFLCCHPAVPAESRVALALKTVCGFGTGEVARALLTSEANAEKRITRAKERLREEPAAWESPGLEPLRDRLDSVLAVVYLLFNEGYWASHSDVPIRRDLCEEALRLSRMLAAHPAGAEPRVYALVALLGFHAARFAARQSPGGGIVLMEEQDRSTWDWGLIRESMDWMGRSASGEVVSRYHVEAAIAWEHCRATTFAATDWGRIEMLYEALERIAPSPLHRLNRAVAVSFVRGPESGLALLASQPAGDLPARYPVWSAVEGELCSRAGRLKEAERAWEQALALTEVKAERTLIEERLARCRAARSDG